jgi:phenylacetate-CoA ligase
MIILAARADGFLRRILVSDTFLAMKERLASTALTLLRPGLHRHLRELEATQWLCRDDLIEIQKRKLRKLLVHAHNRVPYYRKIFSGQGIDPQTLRLHDDLSRIAFLNKKDIEDNFDSLIAADTRKRDRTLNRSGGSTGSRTRFINDRRAAALLQAHVLRNDRWTGWDSGRKQACLWLAYGDILKSQQWFRRLLNKFVLRRLFLPSRQMDDDVMFRYANAITRFKPDLIAGYASALGLFARFAQIHSLRLHHPRGVISAAEALDDDEREIIESVFGAKVYDRYGSREISSIAQECEAHDGLHINAEHVHVEVVDAAGNPCRPGEIGEIVLTDLDNYAFPLIRYRIGDLGIVSEGRCPCGRGLPLLARVLGRSFDVITTPDKRYLCVSGRRFWTGNIEGIRIFQLIQHDLRTLEFRIVADQAFTPAERRKLERRARERYGSPVDIRITLVEDIPVSESGKHLRVISKISPFSN